jgi:hypothetical protein
VQPAQPLERAAEHPGDLHLRDPDERRDLGLGEVVLEAQAQHRALARAEAADEGREVGPLLGRREAVVVAADRVAECDVGVVVGALRRVERGGAVGTA